MATVGARSVRHARGAIALCCSVQVRAGHAHVAAQDGWTQPLSTTGRQPTGRSLTQLGRRSLARATAPRTPATRQIRSGLHQQLQLTAGIGRREHDEPIQPEQRSTHRRSSVRSRLGFLPIVATWSRSRIVKAPGPTTDHPSPACRRGTLTHSQLGYQEGTVRVAVRSGLGLTRRDASVAPGGILSRHAQHQGPDRLWSGWAARLSSCVRPAAGDEAGVPEQQRSGRHQP